MSFPGIGQWFLLSVRRGFATARELVLPIGVAAFLLSAVLTPLVAANEVVAEQRESESALTQVEVAPHEHLASAAGITRAELDLIRELPHVTGLIPDAAVGVYAADGDTWALAVQTLNPANVPPGLADFDTRALGPDDLIVPGHVDGQDLAALVGSTVRVSYTRMTADRTGELEEREVKVVAAYDPAWQGYGSGVALAGSDLVTELLAARDGLSANDFLAQVGLPAVIVSVDAADHVEATTRAVREMGMNAVPVADRLGALPGIFAAFPALLAVSGAASALLLAIHLTRAVQTSIAERLSEFGLLRIRGWSAARLRRLIVLDVVAGSVAGAFVGGASGSVLGALVLQALPGIEVSTVAGWMAATTSASLVTLGTGLFGAAVSVLAGRRSLRADPFIVVTSRTR